MQCFTRKQTCNGEYTKHCTRSRHQLKMAAPAEVSEKRSNFRIRQFKEKRLFNIAANLTLNTMASFVILLIARTARIACVRTYRQTDRQTHETTTVTLSAHARRGLTMYSPFLYFGKVIENCSLPCLVTACSRLAFSLKCKAAS